MAGKTEFTKLALETIFSEYNLGEVKRSKPFKRGYVQTNILVTTTKGRYVLRYYENRNKEYVLFEANLLEFIHKHHYPSAKAIRNSHGKLIGTYQKKPFMVFEYVIGRHYKRLNHKQTHEIVKHLALLHTITSGYRPKFYQSRETKDESFCLSMARSEAKRNKKQGQERLEFISERLKDLKIPNALPKGVIHGDFDKANVKFSGDDISGILDFDDAGYTVLIYDLAALILYWAWLYKRSFDLQEARNIIDIYQEYRALSASEKKHLYDVLQLVMLNFMAWFVTDTWKGIDLHQKMRDMLCELRELGRKKFYTVLFSTTTP